MAVDPYAGRRGRRPAVRAELNVRGLMRRVNEIRAARGGQPVPRHRWPSDRRDLQPYIDEVLSARDA